MPIDGVVASGGMKYTIVTPIGFIPLSTDASNITVLSSGSTDDGYFTVDLPFTTYFNGIGYNQLFVGTNGYVTFGGGSTVFSSPSSSNPPFNKIMVGTADRSSNGVYYLNSGTSWKLRSNCWTGNSLNGILCGYELECFNSDPKNIRLSIGTSLASGVFGVYTPTTLVAPLSTLSNISYNIKSA